MSIIPNFAFLRYVLEPFEVRLVGGAVRDILSGIPPKDYDFSTTCLPEIVMEKCRDAGAKAQPTGLQHGTVTIITHEGVSEVTTLRVDEFADGRWAEVKFTDDWQKDAARRDFTINAMSMDFNGDIYDYYGGERDIATGQVRFVGDAGERIREDYLRIMRYFRFAGRVNGFPFEVKTLDAIKENMIGINKISGERIANELGKIVDCFNKNGVMFAMNDVGLMNKIRIPFRIAEMWDFTRNNNARSPFELILASFFRSTEEVDYFYERVRITGAQKKLISLIVENKERGLIKSELVRMIETGFDRSVLLKIAKFQDDLEAVYMLHDDNLPKFPVTQGEISFNPNIPKRNIKKVYLQLLEEWINSNYKLTKEELLWKQLQE